MNILFLGDLVSPASVDAVEQFLRRLRKETKLDLVIANAENVHTRNGITQAQFDSLRMIGIDVVTLGNHAWDHHGVYQFIDDHPELLRPYNYPPGTPGQGSCVVDAGHRQVAVLVAMGNVHVSTLPSPFLDITQHVASLHNEGVRHIIVEIHAEATAEKNALAYYLDGQVSAVLGTHTHIPTADARILPKGTAFQTDVGMNGPQHSVIGMEVDIAVQRFCTQRRVRYAQPETDTYVCNGTLLELDNEGKACAIRPIQETIQLR